MPLDAFAVRRASADGRQSTCRSCAADHAKRTHPRKLAEAPEVRPGQKWCRRCETVKGCNDFPVHRGTSDGRQTYCRECFADIYRERRERDGQVVRPPRLPEGHKFCRGCQQVKPLSEWAPRRSTKDGYGFRCRECMSRRDRDRHLAASYGLKVEAVAELLSTQAGRCAICLLRPAVHVDHDHETGEVRGMLCFRCNAALGQLDDDVDRLHRAADYLRGRRLVIRSPHPGVFVIGRRDPAPSSKAGAEESSPRRDLVDVAALRAKARGA
jgi:hypothetical protein